MTCGKSNTRNEWILLQSDCNFYSGINSSVYLVHSWHLNSNKMKTQCDPPRMSRDCKRRCYYSAGDLSGKSSVRTRLISGTSEYGGQQPLASSTTCPYIVSRTGTGHHRVVFMLNRSPSSALHLIIMSPDDNLFDLNCSQADANERLQVSTSKVL